jgi:FkbM family methyltransferase
MKSKIKRGLNQILPPIIVSTVIKFRNRQGKYFGPNRLDEKLEKFMNYDGGYFVELGANDGKFASNTLFFEKYRGWNGVLVEPIPQKYLECLKNRSPRTSSFCNVCVSFDYHEKFVELLYSNSMTVSANLPNDLGDVSAHAALGKQFLLKHEEVFSFGSRAATLSSLLDKAGSPARMDLVSLDVEGVEIEVLKGLNHEQYRFKYLCIESRSIDQLVEYLEPFGYELIANLTHHDYLFSDMSNESC